MRRSENSVNSFKYFIDPTLRPDIRQLNIYLKKGILEKDEFLKYIYDNLEGIIKSEAYVDNIIYYINHGQRMIRTHVKEAIKSPDYSNYWDRNSFNNYADKMAEIKRELDYMDEWIHKQRERVIKNAINELWENARAYGININMKSKNLYEIIFLCLFILESYDKRIENEMRALANIRQELYSIVSSQTIFDSIENWRRAALYDKTVVWIDNFLCDYNKFDEEKKCTQLQFAKKI